VITLLYQIPTLEYETDKAIFAAVERPCPSAMGAGHKQHPAAAAVVLSSGSAAAAGDTSAKACHLLNKVIWIRLSAFKHA